MLMYVMEHAVAGGAEQDSTVIGGPILGLVRVWWDGAGPFQRVVSEGSTAGRWPR